MSQISGKPASAVRGEAPREPEQPGSPRFALDQAARLLSQKKRDLAGAEALESGTSTTFLSRPPT